jgi:hypothetical protein
MIDNLHRWSYKLSSFHYTIEHIPGSLNVWADMLTRWAASDSFPSFARRFSEIPSSLVCPMGSGGFQFPKFSGIVSSKNSFFFGSLGYFVWFLKIFS